MDSLILVRYGTPCNSWISAYANIEVAKKYIVENALIHFFDRHADDDDDIPNATDMECDIKLQLNQREAIIEIDDWSAEIEYNERVKEQ